MRQNRLFFLLFTFFFACPAIYAQVAIPAAGGNSSGSGGTVSYSVGQVFYSNITGANGSVAQGVQQSYKISTSSGTDVTGITLKCSVYPNPTTDVLMLKIEGELGTQYSASLYDMTGKLLETRIIKANETPLSMRTLTQATYFLKVTDNTKEVKTFKIIKN